MKQVRQLLVVGLIAVFAFGTLVHAASATTMAVDMAITDIQSDGDGICQACPDDSNSAPLCDLICLTTFVALPISLQVERIASEAAFGPAPDRDTISQIGSPDPGPPKSIIQV
ncbi:MAG: hypothetical protein ACFE0S_13455 [Rhodospirillales bacterium]